MTESTPQPESRADNDASGSAIDAVAPYRPKVRSVSTFHVIRGLRCHLRVWETGAGLPGPMPTLLCLHGWMDVSASFQFVVDSLAGRWRVVAPDWRGFGLSEALPGRSTTVDSYAFADYLGDLDAVIDIVRQDAPADPVRLVAHSMGGNVATLYAGIRPGRVAGLVNLEGFGLAPTDPSQAVGRWRRWLDELSRTMDFRPYASLAAVAGRLMRNNPRLAPDRALFLAGHWAQPVADGFMLRADPAHKRINPVPYRVDEALSCWRAITAPVLWVQSTERSAFHQYTLSDEYRQRLLTIARLKVVDVADAGHMVHHDQPGQVAGLIEEFFRHG